MKYDAILILGGGVRAGGQLPPWVEARLDRALQRWQGEWLLPLSRGTVHVPPPLNEAGFPLDECWAEARYLMAHGADPGCIWPEGVSLDTVGSAYFARVLHIDPAGLRRLLVITSSFHLPRAEAIFRKVFALDAPPGGYELTFEATPDAGLSPEVLQSRRQKEEQSLITFNAQMIHICTLREFHAWLYSQHAAYAVGQTPAQASGIEKNTY